MPSSSGGPPRLRPRGEVPPRTQLRERAGALGVHPLLVHLLHARGITELSDQTQWLGAGLGQLRPPEAMAGFVAALDLLEQAWRKRWRVGVFGDYDVDGVTTATLLSTYLEALGLPVVVLTADRSHGYGFTPQDAEALVEARVDLVVTGDVGTSDIEALELLRARGVPVIVIDHHHVPTTEPPADAFINPHQPGCQFPFKGLCSAGVAFYLCAGLRTRLRRNSPAAFPDPRAWLDLVALATVCDMMPLREENRVLTRAGLRELNRRARPGVRALLQAAGIEENAVIDEETVGFKLGPRINAAGRLGPAEPALRLLRARTSAEAQPLAELLEALNTKRRRYSEETVGAALALVEADGRSSQRSALVVAQHGWLPGIVGIVAANLTEVYGRPAMVLAIDDVGIARGSVRGVPGVHLLACLERCAPLLQRFGGHREAAGVTLRAADIPELVEAFDEAVGTSARDDAEADEIVDCQLPLRLVDESLCAALTSLRPFGMAFEPPRFWVDRCRVETVRVLKEKHLLLTLGQGDVKREGIAFGQAGLGLQIGELVGCIFVPAIDRFRGEARLRLQVERLWRCSPEC